MPPISNPAATLEYQIAQEKASALGRLGRELERALSALRAFDIAHGRFAGLTGELTKRRDNLVAEAAQALCTSGAAGRLRNVQQICHGRLRRVSLSAVSIAKHLACLVEAIEQRRIDLFRHNGQIHPISEKGSTGGGTGMKLTIVITPPKKHVILISRRAHDCWRRS
jgi:hypothetical protein